MSSKNLLVGYDRETVLNLIEKADLYEYGTINENLAAKIRRITEEHKASEEPMMAAGALNNNDFSGMLLRIAKEAPEKILKGLAAVACAVQAERIILYLPEGETALADTFREIIQKNGLETELASGITDARLMRDGITCHLETLAAVSDVLEGTYEPGTWISMEKYTADGKEEVKAPEKIPFDTVLGTLLGDMRNVRAVQVGDHLYLPEEASGLTVRKELALGDGVIRLYGEDCCLLDMAVKKLRESRRKSCGKCTFCREGLLQLYTRMKEITDGKGDLASPGIMEDIGEVMTFSCSCTIGNSGSIFTLDTLAKFEQDYSDHIRKRKCTAGTCLAFINMYIDPKKCTGCGECLSSCPDNFIEGLPGYIHMIEDVDCTKCGKCMESCPEQAIVRTAANVPPLPDRLTKAGRFKRY